MRNHSVESTHLSVDENGEFLFKPLYKVKGKNSSLPLIKKHCQDGKGGVSDLNKFVSAVNKYLEAKFMLFEIL